MNTLRKDERQWLIYHEESVVAAVRSLEVLALLAAGPMLAKHPDIEIRALGNVMMKLGRHREEYMLGVGQGEPTEEEQVAGRHLATILGEWAGVARADRERSELHAAIFWLDSRLSAAGIKGKNWTAETALGKR